MQKCVGLDLRRKPERIMAIIDGLDADLVILQEADKRMAPRHAALPSAMVRAAGWQVVPFGADDSDGVSLGWHGNAMLMRGDVQLVDTGRIDLPGLEPRGAIRADLTTPIGPLRVIGVHLGLIRRHRQAQLAHIRAELNRLPDSPAVLAGDFNEWGALGKAMSFGSPRLAVAATPLSYPAPRPVARLDRILHSSDLRVAATGGGASRGASRIASDHLPIWADFTAIDQ
ncbi:endonuclease/exonuclease/phosphatase family protein [Roseovarius sp. M141]|uniref:endonuclease/exonuclease/phosphatase family protein n=1 Tax=Roseovarius sp. M141 TaxID=2583806 RepID=UPI0020CC7868|nr:endonuclease/exonuclease/phosphatase family protein [Roseovarius sp. M141]